MLQKLADFRLISIVLDEEHFYGTNQSQGKNLVHF